MSAVLLSWIARGRGTGPCDALPLFHASRVRWLCRKVLRCLIWCDSCLLSVRSSPPLSAAVRSLKPLLRRSSAAMRRSPPLSASTTRLIPRPLRLIRLVRPSASKGRFPITSWRRWSPRVQRPARNCGRCTARLRMRTRSIARSRASRPAARSGRKVICSSSLIRRPCRPPLVRRPVLAQRLTSAASSPWPGVSCRLCPSPRARSHPRRLTEFSVLLVPGSY